MRCFSSTEQGEILEKIERYTPSKHFFLSMARIWRVKTREAYLRSYIKNNAHSPPMWLVNGHLMNFIPFYEAFDVKPSDKSYKPLKERIKL